LELKHLSALWCFFFAVWCLVIAILLITNSLGSFGETEWTAAFLLLLSITSILVAVGILLGPKTGKETKQAPLSRAEKSDYSRYHELALNLYNSAAQFNATCFVAVIFGQFAILTLLKGVPDLLFTWQVLCLIGVYILILILGCYLILDYLMFAQFIEKLRGFSGTAPLTILENDLTEKIERDSRWKTIPGTKCLSLTWFRNGRGSILQRPGMNLIFCAAYLIVSVIVLLAAMLVVRSV
jgi:hypothetical protein